LRENPSVPSAASKAGISPVTLNRWLQRGEEGDPKFAEFALEAAEARRTMKDEVVAALYKTSTDELHPQQTKAAHLLLTNLYPTEFANVKHTVSHKHSAEPAYDLSQLPTDELRQLHATLKKIKAIHDGEPPPALRKAPILVEVLDTDEG
jgi:hypothetical protein